jgi:hypothetical protein
MISLIIFLTMKNAGDFAERWTDAGAADKGDGRADRTPEK